MIEELVRLLREKQDALNETNEQFSARLGVSRSTWDKTATGAMPVGWLVLRGAAKAFPDLRDMAIAYLLGDFADEGGEASQA